MFKLKGLNWSMQIVIGTIIAIAVTSIIFSITATAVQGQADQATCTGWLRPVLSTLADLTGVDLC